MQQPTPGSTLQTQSPWLFLDEAQTIFAAARGRVYSGKISGQISNGLSAGLVPVLEEQPKWEVLANILDEIEREIYFSPLPDDDSHSTILIMCEEDEDNLLYHQLRDYIQAYQHSRKLAEDGSSFNLGHPMLRRRLRRYFRWKQHLPSLRASFQEDLRTGRYVTELNHGHSSSRRGRPPQSKRRRTRGGNSAVASSNRVSDMQTLGDLDPTTMAAAMFALAVTDGDDHFGHGILVDQFTGLKDCFRMCDPQELVVVHPYKADRDDKILEELKPRYIIMYTPDPAFVRRVEVSGILSPKLWWSSMPSR